MTTSNTKKIAVTGGAGFLGSHVVQLLLDARHQVVVLDDFSNGKDMHLTPVVNHPALTVIRGDVIKREDVQRAFAGCEVVIHLAVLCLRQSIKDPERVNEVIVDGTLQCLNVAREHGIGLFLNCSSSEVYGSAETIPMSEGHPLNPETPYAAAKVAQDMYVASYGRTYGIAWATIRPFNMYGPHSHWQGHRGELIPKMIVRAMNRQPLVVFGDGSQTRDFIFVRDAARAVVSIVDNESVRNMSINVCSGAETTILRIAELICENFGLDPKTYIERQPPRPGDVRRHLGDNSRFAHLLGFVPEVRPEAGIRETVDWFRSLQYTPAELLRQEALRNWE